MASELSSVDLGSSGPVELDQLQFDLSEPSVDSGLDFSASNEDVEEVSALSDLLTVSANSHAVTLQNPEPLGAEGIGHGDLGEVEGQTQQKYQSSPDIIKSTLCGNDVGGKDAENVPNPVKMGNDKMPEIAKVHVVERQTTEVYFHCHH